LERAFAKRPVLTLYIDGVDEKYGNQGLPAEARSVLCEMIREATGSCLNGSPYFGLVLSCRDERDLRGLGGGGFPLAQQPTVFTVSEFSNGELLSLARRYQGCPRIARRIQDHLAIRQTTRRVAASNEAPSNEVPVDPDRIEIIRHPVFWRCFTEILSEMEQHSFLDGTPESKASIANSYIEWFFQKVNARIGTVTLNATHVAMRNSAKRFLTGNPEREADLYDDWLTPCESAGCPETHRMPIFYEAVSAGLIEPNGPSSVKWRWKRPWLCEYFANEESVHDYT